MDTLPARLAHYAEQWKLSNFHLVEYYSVNCLFFCCSEKYGDSVIKIFGCESMWYIDEILILKEVDGKFGYVRAYEYDEKGGALLLERISPGTTLKSEPLLEKRLSIFADMLQKTYIIPSDPSVFKNYLKTVEDAAEKQIKCGKNQELERLSSLMVSVCKDLYDIYPERILLHADLHGDNLLKDRNGNYKIVDPHARIGPQICDLGRYIANEYNDARKDNRSAIINTIISRLSDFLKFPQIDIARAFYVDSTLMTCWDAEDGAFNLEGALFAEAYLKNIAMD